MATNRIPGHVVVGPTSSQASLHAGNAVGAWRGRTLAPLPGTSNHADALRHASAYALPAMQRALGSRSVIAEGAFRRLQPNEIFQRAQTLGVAMRAVRAEARAMLTGRAGDAKTGRLASTSRYLGLQLLATALEDEVSEQEAIALLTPVRERGTTPQDLSELLRHMANDGEEFEHFVEDILASLDTTSQDAEELAAKLRQARNDDGKLMELLRTAQKIPRLHREQDAQVRDRLRQQVQDEIREFERSNQGALVLASFNAAPAAAKTTDPGTFLQTYTELVMLPRSFAAALKLLLSRHPVESLDALIDHLKKALGDDLNAATPSQDARRLGAVLTDLGHMTLSTGLIESVRELLELMERTALRRKDEDEKERGGRDYDGGEDEDADAHGDVPRTKQGSMQHGRGR